MERGAPLNALNPLSTCMPYPLSATRKHVIDMSTYVKTSIVNILIHGFGLIALVTLNDITLHFYRSWIGDFWSRGIAPGMVIRLVLLIFCITNLLIAFTPNRSIKIGLAVAFILVTAWFLLPAHPLRALLYCTSGGMITLFSIYLSSQANKKLAWNKQSI